MTRRKRRRHEAKAQAPGGESPTRNEDRPHPELVSAHVSRPLHERHRAVRHGPLPRPADSGVGGGGKTQGAIPKNPCHVEREMTPDKPDCWICEEVEQRNAQLAAFPEET